MDRKKRITIIVNVYMILLNIIVLINLACSTTQHAPIVRLNDTIPLEVYNLEMDFRKEITSPKDKFVGYTFYKGFSPDAVGFCIDFAVIPFIGIRKTWWDKETPLQRKLLIYHELGHCLCGLDHDDSQFGIDKGYCPKSLMNSFTTDDYCFVSNWEHYIKDLEKKCNQK